MLRDVINRVMAFPVWVWWPIAALAFLIPVLEYWITGKSHPNGLAGFLPWADATEYFFCSQTFLLNLPGPDHCGKRPFYLAFFTDLLWVTGNRMQLALLLQAIIVGLACLALINELRRDLPVHAVMAAFAVCFLYAAAFGAGLVMTENVGLLFGALALAVFWRMGNTPDLKLFLLGTCLMTAAVTVRPGPLFVLPALMCWYFFFSRQTLSWRVAGVALAVVAVLLGFALSMIPSFVAGKSLGEAHSNFSFALYGLVVGGKGWQQITIDHPELFAPGIGGKELTDRVYAAAYERLKTQPHLFVLGYIKGVFVYFDDLFRYANDFKPLRYPLRFVCLLLPWAIGLYYTIRNWKDPSFALLLSLQAGIIVSSPFIAIDGYNRVFASTTALDAIFVAFGIMVLSNYFTRSAQPSIPDKCVTWGQSKTLTATALTAMLLPVFLPAMYRTTDQRTGLSPPRCPEGLEAVIVRPGRSSLVLPLVDAGKETIFPVSVRADHFGTRFSSHVQRKNKLRQPAGTMWVWGTRLDANGLGQNIYFKWSGRKIESGRYTGFCLERAFGTVDIPARKIFRQDFIKHN